MIVNKILAGLRDTINKAYGKPVASFGSEAVILRSETGIFDIDYKIGALPRGRWIIVGGQESTFKSTFCYMSASKTQRICGSCFSGKISEINHTPVNVPVKNPDNVITQSVKGKTYSLAYLADKNKTVIYCPGEEIKGDDKKMYKFDLECSNCGQPAYSITLLVDGEHNYTKKWATKQGLVHFYVLLVRTENSEQTGDMIKEALSTGRISTVIVDSVSSQGSVKEDEAAIGDEQMGIQARVWNKIVRVITSKLNSFYEYSFKNKNGEDVKIIKQNEPILMVINQFREKIGGYGNPLVFGAGWGLKYASSVTIIFSSALSDVVWINKDAGEAEGRTFHWVLQKQKTGTPLKKGSFYFSFITEKVDNERGVFNMAVEKGKIIQGGAWYTYGNTKVQGADKMFQTLLASGDIEKLRLEFLNESSKETI